MNEAQDERRALVCPKRIGILVLKASTGAGGLETYEIEMVRAIASLDSFNEYHVICASPVDPAAFEVQQPNVTFHRLCPDARIVALSIGFPILARRLRLDAFHVTFVPPLWSGCPYVFTAHGPEMFVDPHFYPLAIRLRMNTLIRHGYRNAAHIVAVSESTSEYLQAHFKVPASRISVAYNGVNPAFRPFGSGIAQRAVASRFGLTNRYLLFVGRVEPRKNPVRVIEAFALARAHLTDGTRLVIAGDKTWSAREVDRAIMRLGLGAHVCVLGHISLEALIQLYGAADMLVYPSLWEGFGLPIIEAMACGTPVVTANIAAMPEVAGGGATLVNPNDSVDIARGIIAVAQRDQATRQREREFGFKRAKSFTWRSAAQKTISAYLGAIQCREDCATS